MTDPDIFGVEVGRVLPEWMTLHVDLETRRVAPWPAQILADISRVAHAQGDWPYPQEAGHEMGMQKPIFSIRKRVQ